MGFYFMGLDNNILQEAPESKVDKNATASQNAETYLFESNPSKDHQPQLEKQDMAGVLDIGLENQID